jgi:hypothetical protein
MLVYKRRRFVKKSKNERPIGWLHYVYTRSYPETYNFGNNKMRYSTLYCGGLEFMRVPTYLHQLESC